MNHVHHCGNITNLWKVCQCTFFSSQEYSFWLKNVPFVSPSKNCGDGFLFHKLNDDKSQTLMSTVTSGSCMCMCPWQEQREQMPFEC